ncbi:MAG: Beta-lactamase class C and other penicillin binding proteins [uncultured Aureispira sp.]|uniref:Beta-lactamase class C and other penicillin binding proteins n=1 Tax=uncultured Aureispira sp. TaxID=1331704 RepID=A0A6S6S3J6_9BACT|nr:MAG: Beta-lactamase class C and other penicillin binding proteins [uncultured Aureispira sp.]
MAKKLQENSLSKHPIKDAIMIKRPIKIQNLFLLSILVASLTSCSLGRFIVYNFADAKDHKKFPNRVLEKPETSFHFAARPNKTSPAMDSFEYALAENKTLAFLVIRNDTITYEKYFNKYDSASIVPSFSMAKSILSILIGCAIEEGLIDSIEEPMTNYVPELKKNGFDKVTIKHLLQMTSGLKFNEGYFNPFGHVATFYYGLNLRRQIKHLKLKQAPGQSMEYVSGNTQLLGLVLERALDGKQLTTYLQEKLWTPLGMEYDASWSIDRKKNGLEKAFCCINARARDFAKIGRLYLNKGNWEGTQIVSEEWVRASTKYDNSEGGYNGYQYQWWIPTANGDFMAQGVLGQYVYVHPKKNLIVVRLGKNYGKLNWRNIFLQIAAGT